MRATGSALTETRGKIQSTLVQTSVGFDDGLRYSIDTVAIVVVLGTNLVQEVIVGHVSSRRDAFVAG